MAKLFSDGGDIFGKPYAREVARIVNGKATLILPDIAHDQYAVSVFHDENSNNDLDHNFMRLPAEPLGFSNGFKMSVFSGTPSFDKLRFEFGSYTKPLEITVK